MLAFVDSSTPPYLPLPSPPSAVSPDFRSYMVLPLGDLFCVLGTCAVYESGFKEKSTQTRSVELCALRSS
jgi:hypothetical protein